MPALSELRLREATTGRLDRFVRAVGKNIGAPTANIVKGILKGIMGMAARYDTVPSNPARDVHVHKVETAAIRALTLAESKAMRQHAEDELATRTTDQRLAKTGDARRMGGRNRSGVLLDIIDALIATGVRPGGVLAIRSTRLELEVEVPSVRIDSTIMRIKGQGLVIQENTKANDIRRLALPQFAVDLFTRALQERQPNEWDVVFTSATGTLMDPRNLGHAWTKTFAGSDFAWVTPKTLRKTVATLIDAEHGSEKAARQLGHASDEMTRKHYIEPSKAAIDQRQTLSQFRDE
ncbi:integrase [Arthrobacter sp. UYCu511]|uniref:tyrosine-type recombinase/integrase n=1 Tax=Arthrobacter sp. UYCu511 TaxID=3156337 RepID=UPI0033960225